MNLEPWAIAIVPLGVVRLLQLALVDRIFERPRRWLLARTNPEGFAMHDDRRSYLSYLIECQWCMSTWLGAVVLAGLSFEVSRPVALWILAAGALSLLAVIGDRAVDRWFPDAPSVVTSGDHVRAGAVVPPAVADAFETGADTIGSG